MKKLMFVLAICTTLFACDTMQQVANNASGVVGTSAYTPSTSEMADGLKNALNIGIENAVGILSNENGFLGDPSVKIPFPQEIITVKEKLDGMGLSSVTDKFVNEMNKGASIAVKEAMPIFKQAILEMTFEDAKNILLGDKNAATNYFKTKTSQKLYDAFKPKVSEVLDKYGISKVYTNMMDTYNKIPLVKKMNTDLADYVTKKAMEGLFLKVALEEAKIRDNLSSRVNDVLKKIFGWADSQKK